MARDKSIKIRLGDDEREDLDAAVENGGFRHISEFMRFAVNEAKAGRLFRPDG